MDIKKFIFTLLILLYAIGGLRAQEKHVEHCVDFRVNITKIEPSYSNNAARLDELLEFLSGVRRDTTQRVVRVSFRGAASPEGAFPLNVRLARARMASLESVVRSEMNLPDSIVTRNDSYIPWDFLQAQIESSDLAYKDDVLAILSDTASMNIQSNVDKRIARLKQLNGGRVWQQLYQLYFKPMRNASVVFVTRKQLPPEPEPEPVKVVEPPMEVVPQEIIPAPDTVRVEPAPQVEEWSPKLYVKTNALGWGVAVSNAAVEVDLAKHWSVALPIYYSTWNYFTSTIKFRAFAVQPEARYWFSEDNTRFFVGAHLGMAYYNVAVNGGYRYQDHNGKSPALGGGLAVGYRMPISKNKRWGMEFTVGAGGYKLHYDKFYNTDHTVNGLKIDSHKRTYWGLDQAAISFSYMFDLNKKGGKR